MGLRFFSRRALGDTDIYPIYQRKSSSSCGGFSSALTVEKLIITARTAYIMRILRTTRDEEVVIEGSVLRSEFLDMARACSRNEK